MNGFTYLIDVYTVHVNSAVAAMTFASSVLAAAFVMFANPLYERLDVDWATSVLAFFSLLLTPFPILGWFYGKRVRMLSKWAVHR